MMPMNHDLERLQRSGIRVFTNLARQTADCRMLTIGEPDLDTPKEIREAAARAMEAGQTHYAPNQGTESLRRPLDLPVFIPNGKDISHLLTPFSSFLNS